MKGIILAGGAGTRLNPITKVVSKQLLPVYDKPMIYYPLSVLMSAGISEILIITTPRDQDIFFKLLGSGNQWGINITYASQPEPKGIAEAFLIGEHFICCDNVALILGDNLFWSETLSDKLKESSGKPATIFSYVVDKPENFGVIETENGIIKSIEEKPQNPKSKEVSVGLYVYDSSVVEISRSLKPSDRNEYEITDVNNHFIKNSQLTCSRLNAGSVWLDTGSADSLLEAAEFVRTIQKRQGLLIGSPEVEAYKNGWIKEKEVIKIAEKIGKSSYAESIKRIF